jgi:hypothetical protein
MKTESRHTQRLQSRPTLWLAWLAAAWLMVPAPQAADAAMQQLVDEAKKGDVSSQLKVAWSYVDKQDWAAADYWLQQARERGSITALEGLGLLYLNPDNPKMDSKKGVQYFGEAAMGGRPRAQYIFGGFLLDGVIGAPQNRKEGLKWIRTAAEADYPAAQERLAELYEKGIAGHLEPSRVEALAWARRALAARSSVRGGLAEAGPLLKQIERLQADMDETQVRLVDRRTRSGSAASVEIPDLDKETRCLYTGQGSGFFITADGYLVTNHHVVEGGAVFLLKTVYGLQRARLVFADEHEDLAVLKTDGPVQPAPLMPDDRLTAVGMAAFAYGYPDALLLGHAEPKYSDGKISALHGMLDNPNHLQITVPINGGNSGGGLFDMKGNVVGIVVAKAVGKDLVNYAIKGSRLGKLIRENPEIRAGLPPPHLFERPSEEVVDQVRQSVMLVLNYAPIPQVFTEWFVSAVNQYPKAPPAEVAGLVATKLRERGATDSEVRSSMQSERFARILAAAQEAYNERQRQSGGK